MCQHQKDKEKLRNCFQVRKTAEKWQLIRVTDGVLDQRDSVLQTTNKDSLLDQTLVGLPWARLGSSWACPPPTGTAPAPPPPPRLSIPTFPVVCGIQPSSILPSLVSYCNSPSVKSGFAPVSAGSLRQYYTISTTSGIWRWIVEEYFYRCWCFWLRVV